jgi:hypothetical protein
MNRTASSVVSVCYQQIQNFPTSTTETPVHTLTLTHTHTHTAAAVLQTSAGYRPPPYKNCTYHKKLHGAKSLSWKWEVNVRNFRIWSFITVFTSIHYWSLAAASWIHSKPHAVSLRPSILIKIQPHVCCLQDSNISETSFISHSHYCMEDT